MRRRGGEPLHLIAYILLVVAAVWLIVVLVGHLPIWLLVIVLLLVILAFL